jgi:hypothetical protein
MASLPTTLLGFITVAGGVSALGGVLVYIGKKALDIAADVVKTRLLKEHPKEFIVIYAPDGTVAKRVEAESN